MSEKRPIPRVALILDLHNHIHRGVMLGVCAYVRENGPWNFVWLQQNSALPWPNWGNLAPDGIIAHAPNREHALYLQQANSPLVSLGEEIPGVTLHHVGKDHAMIGVMGAEHLLARGLQTLAFCGHASLPSARDTAKGFSQTVTARRGRYYEIVLRFPLCSDWHWEDHAAEIIPWLNALPKPAGLLACNDYFARQMLSAAESIGRAVPSELAIVGINDNPIECQLSHVPISSVAVAAENIGWEACRLLAGQMGKVQGTPSAIRVAPIGVVARHSSDVLAVDDTAIAAAIGMLQAGHAHLHGVEELVRASGLSRRAFEVRFRKAIGVAPYEEIIRFRLAKARSLLAHTDLTIEAIAEECGFGEAKSLYHHFRKIAGVTPAAFRRAVCFVSHRPRTSG